MGAWGLLCGSLNFRVCLEISIIKTKNNASFLRILEGTEPPTPILSWASQSPVGRLNSLRSHAVEKNILNKLKLMFSQKSVFYWFCFLLSGTSYFHFFLCILLQKHNIPEYRIHQLERISIRKPTLKLSKFNGPHSLPIPEHNLTLKTKQNKQEQKRNAILAQTLLISTEIHKWYNVIINLGEKNRFPQGCRCKIKLF